MSKAPETEVVRTLAAILMADVANYSQLMRKDEPQTVRTLQAYRKIFGSEIDSRAGHVLDAKGDAIMASFRSAVNALEAAVEIQNKIAKENAALLDDLRMQFRIGINLGDVVEDDGTLYGDAVNIAGRLESAADPGGICVSSAVHDQVQGKVPVQFEHLGPQQVKSERFHAYRVTAPTTQSVEDASGRNSPISEEIRPAIVVLPFTNMSGDAEQEYFADGLSEEITTHLSRFRHLTVIARNSAFQYKGKAVDVREVGKELGARFVLEGSVRKAGNRIRVNAQFLDSRDGAHIWAQTYDRELTADSVFDIQDNLTARIVGILADTYGVISQTRLSETRKRGTRNLEAYEWVLHAQANYQELSKDAHRKVQQGLEAAVQIDPNYAEAWAWLAATYRDEYLFYGIDRKPDPLDRAESACNRALELEPDNAEAGLVLAQVFFFRGELEKFKRNANRLINANPNSADVNSAMAIYLSYAGETEQAEDLALRAIQLSPQIPGFAYQPLFVSRYLAGNYEDALSQIERKAQSNYFVYWVSLAAVYGQLGRSVEARQALDRAIELRKGEDLVAILTNRWPDKTLRNAMFDGLRKAGLNAPD